MIPKNPLKTLFGKLEDLKSSADPDKRSAWIGAVLAAIAGYCLGFVFLGSDVPLGEALVQLSYDLPFKFRKKTTPSEAVIVYMDPDAYTQLNQKYKQPWDRALHASLLRKLKEDGAKVVVLDVVFSGASTRESDEALAGALAMKDFKTVIGADWEPTGATGQASGNRVNDGGFFTNIVSGVVQLTTDADFGVRKHWPGSHDGPDLPPSLPWRAAEAVQAEVTQMPGQHDTDRWLNYYGPPGQIPHVGYHMALRTNGTPPGYFRDKTVFVGELPQMTGLPGENKEEKRSPFTFWNGVFSAGVEIQATTFLNLLRKDWLVRPHWLIELFLIAGLGGVAGFGLTLLRPVPAAVCALLAAALLFVLVVFLFTQFRVWFPWLIIVAVQLPLALLWSVIYNSVNLYAEKRALQRTLELHLSPQRVKQILKRPELLRPGAERQDVSILFSDIANFSKVTARMDPEDLFLLLNRYFQESLTCVHSTDGTVIKLIGDAIFAIWNAPFVQPDQQLRACRAALLLRDRLIEFDSSSRSLPLRTRVGLHAGPAFVGNVGSAQRFDYTAIGDTVNLASRLEGLNKHLGTDVLASRDIQKLVEKELVSRRVGHFKFKGFDRIVEVHELVGENGKAQETAPWRKSFEEALHQFQRQNFQGAEAGFTQTLVLRPEDGPSKYYLQKTREMASLKLPDDWAGEISLEEK